MIWDLTEIESVIQEYKVTSEVICEHDSGCDVGLALSVVFDS